MAWGTIPDSLVQVGADLDIDLAADLMKANAEYLFNSALRGGEFLNPVRLGLMRGVVTFLNEDFDTQSPKARAHMTEVAVLFSDGIDGDPNFSAAPTVILSLTEDDSTMDWYTNYVQAHPYIVYNTLTATGFSVGCIGLRGSSNIGVSSGFEAAIRWLAIGPVTTGE